VIDRQPAANDVGSATFDAADRLAIINLLGAYAYTYAYTYDQDRLDEFWRLGRSKVAADQGYVGKLDPSGD
jgi:hypothetical protein